MRIPCFLFYGFVGRLHCTACHSNCQGMYTKHNVDTINIICKVLIKTNLNNIRWYKLFTDSVYTRGFLGFKFSRIQSSTQTFSDSKIPDSHSISCDNFVSDLCSLV